MSNFSISIRELRPKLPEVVADVAESMNSYTITKRGKPAAIIINVDEYSSLLETLGIQSDEALMHEISDQADDSKKKKGVLIEDLKRGL